MAALERYILLSHRFFFFFTCEEQEPVKVVQVSEEDVSCVSW